MEQFLQILKKVTVNSRDNGEKFTDTTRLLAIEDMLKGSEYELIYKGNLTMLYGKRQPAEGEIIRYILKQCFGRFQSYHTLIVPTATF